MDLVEALLQAGADPQLKSHDGRSPADFADINGHPEVAAALRAARWPPSADRG
jgi:ankyrin repeat protein